MSSSTSSYQLFLGLPILTCPATFDVNVAIESASTFDYELLLVAPIAMLQISQYNYMLFNFFWAR